MALKALNSQSNPIPVLVAPPPGGRGLKIFQHFQSFQWVDVTISSDDGFQALVTAIYAAQGSDLLNADPIPDIAEDSVAENFVAEHSEVDDEDSRAKRDETGSSIDDRFPDDEVDTTDSSEFAGLIRKLVDGNESDRAVACGGLTSTDRGSESVWRRFSAVKSIRNTDPVPMTVRRRPTVLWRTSLQSGRGC